MERTIIANQITIESNDDEEIQSNKNQTYQNVKDQKINSTKKEHWNLILYLKGSCLNHLLTCIIKINNSLIEIHSVYPEHNKDEKIILELLLINDVNNHSECILTINDKTDITIKEKSEQNKLEPSNNELKNKTISYVKDSLGALCGLLSKCSSAIELESILASYFATHRKTIEFNKTVIEHFDKKSCRILQKNFQ